MRIRRLALLAGLSLAIPACDLGGVGAGGPDAGTNRNSALGIICNATFKLTGSFSPSSTDPSGDPQNCWPYGNWTFTAAMNTDECQTPPTLLPQYQFTVSQTVDANGDTQDVYAFTSDPSSHYRLKVSGDGGGLCQGGLEIYSMDGKQYWDMKPSLETGNTVDGFGEYALYDSDQWN